MRVLITGANRGIGLEFVRQYLSAGWEVYATARHPEAAADLKRLQHQGGEHLKILKLDLADPRSIELLGRTFERLEEGLELLINNAGTYGSRKKFLEIDAGEITKVFQINCLGAFRLTQRLFPAVSTVKGKLIFITSLMGSIDDNRSGSVYPYRISKTALNMLGKNISEDFKESGIYSLLLHPGWVKTRMGGSGAKLEVETSVSGMREVIARLDRSMSGEFYGYDGQPRPW